MSRRRSVSREARLRATRAAGAASRRLLDRFGLQIPPGARPGLLPRDALVVMPAQGEILYRLLGADEIRERDFLSNRDKGRPCPANLPYIAHCGLSMYEHPDQALIHANRYPLSLAAVYLEAGAGTALAKSFGVGHYTVWASPSRMMSSAEVVAFVPEGDTQDR
jgi:hypothetical protein